MTSTRFIDNRIQCMKSATDSFSKAILEVIAEHLDLENEIQIQFSERTIRASCLHLGYLLL